MITWVIDSAEQSWRFTLDGDEQLLSFGMYLATEEGLLSHSHEIEKGESIEIPLFIRNLGVADIRDVSVALESTEDFIMIREETHNYPLLSADKIGKTPADYDFTVLENAPSNIPYLNMALTMVGKYNGIEYKWVHPFKLGTFFGNIQITSVPSGASVSIQAASSVKSYQITGVTPYEKTSVLGGKYDIQVTKEGEYLDTLLENVNVEEEKQHISISP